MYREFAENEVKPLAKKVDAEEYFNETVEKMGQAGHDVGIYFPLLWAVPAAMCCPTSWLWKS